MQYLTKGMYFGEHKSHLPFNNLVITDTEYTHEHVNWHYHENIYFTYLLRGKLLEANRRESYICSPGTLLFHNWQEPHYNVKYPGYARGFHIELQKEWFENYRVDTELFRGSLRLQDAYMKNLVDCIYREQKHSDESVKLTIDGLLLQIFGRMMKLNHTGRQLVPEWLSRTAEMIRDNYGRNISLATLSEQAAVHPVYLSNAFHRHFKMTIGQFARKARVEAAIRLLDDAELTLAEISSTCGFSDQSHFNRIFKSITGLFISAGSMYLGFFLAASFCSIKL